MSLRYVWSKWNKTRKLGKSTYSLSSYSAGSTLTYFSTGQGVGYYYGTSVEDDGDHTPTIVNKRSSESKTIAKGTYFSSPGNASVYYASSDTVWTYTNAGYNDTFDYTLKITSGTGYIVQYSDAKGSTQYDNVVSDVSSTYPSNGIKGSYWYVLLGSDTIDPSALTMTGEVKAGETVTLTITPSATIAYGGTVTYTVQTTTDGDNWYDAGTTTDTTMTLTVPEAAAWNARVIASDDTGFTSTTAVYANGSEDLVSVINVGFIPKSGWIGYKNTKNLLLVSATGTAGETVNISASLDGTQVITGSTTSGVSYQLTLTDEQFEAVSEGESHTLTVTAQYATSGTSETRTYTFRKFTYDETSEGGVMEGAARAIREKNGSESTILGSKIPYEIIQIGAGGTATEADVLSGKTFFTEEGWKTGTAGKPVMHSTASLKKTSNNTDAYANLSVTPGWTMWFAVVTQTSTSSSTTYTHLFSNKGNLYDPSATNASSQFRRYTGKDTSTSLCFVSTTTVYTYKVDLYSW